jgi:5-methylcytosine-specific restriction enzyme B
MNNTDRSLAMMDYALRRRFSFFKLTCNTVKLGQWLEAHNCKVNIEKLIKNLKNMNQKVKSQLNSEDFLIGHSYFMEEGLTAGRLDMIIKYQIAPLLEEYFFEDVSAYTGILKIWQT